MFCFCFFFCYDGMFTIIFSNSFLVICTVKSLYKKKHLLYHHHHHAWHGMACVSKCTVTTSMHWQLFYHSKTLLLLLFSSHVYQTILFHKTIKHLYIYFRKISTKKYHLPPHHAIQTFSDNLTFKFRCNVCIIRRQIQIYNFTNYRCCSISFLCWFRWKVLKKKKKLFHTFPIFDVISEFWFVYILLVEFDTTKSYMISNTYFNYLFICTFYKMFIFTWAQDVSFDLYHYYYLQNIFKKKLFV